MEAVTDATQLMPQVEYEDSTDDHVQEHETIKPENSVPDTSFDQKEPEPEAVNAEEEEKDVVNILVPKANSVKWTFGPDNVRREYVQRPLSFIAKMQWFSLVGEVLDKALSGENGMSLNNLFSAPGRPGELSMADFRDADTFVQAIGKLLAVAPDFLVKSYCIWLAVPDYERDLVGEIMALPVDQGGLSDEQGIEIIEVFIDQNYEALDRFFRDLLGNLSTRVSNRMEEANQRRSSRPSRR